MFSGLLPYFKFSWKGSGSLQVTQPNKKKIRMPWFLFHAMEINPGIWDSCCFLLTALWSGAQMLGVGPAGSFGVQEALRSSWTALASTPKITPCKCTSPIFAQKRSGRWAEPTGKKKKRARGMSDDVRHGSVAFNLLATNTSMSSQLMFRVVIPVLFRGENRVVSNFNLPLNEGDFDHGKLMGPVCA